MTVVGMGSIPPTPAELREQRCELLLLDVGATSTTALAALHSEVPQLPVVMIGASEDTVVQFAEAGAVGFVPREALMPELVRTLEEVARHGASCPARLLAVLLAHVARSVATNRLTAREAEVVALVQRGRSNKEIAYALGIELPTVKNHVHNILEKLQLDSRSAVAARSSPAPHAELHPDRGLPAPPG